MIKIFAIVCISSTAFGQVPMLYTDQGAQFQKVIELGGKTNAEIYKSAYKWVTITFKNPEAVIKGEVENELIKGNGSDNVGMPGISYAFAIDVKDGKLRITINDIKIGRAGPVYSIETYVYKKDGSERSNSQAQGIKNDVSADVNGLIKSLEQYLISPSDDW